MPKKTTLWISNELLDLILVLQRKVRIALALRTTKENQDLSDLIPKENKVGDKPLGKKRIHKTQRSMTLQFIYI